MAAAAATQTELDPTILVIAAIFFVFWLFCGFKCAANERWGLFAFGFLCGWAWLAGWMMGPKRRAYY